MRAILGLLIAVGIGWVVIYYAGGYSSFDPTEQGRKAQAAVQPG